MVLASDLSSLNQELDEITLLTAQAATETERHETRRQKAEEKVAAMEADPRVDAAELREARSQLLILSRRAVLFEAQQQVLEGKGRTLARFRDRLQEIDQMLSGAPATTPLAQPTGAAASESERAVLLRAQEELRKDIARHMHDGPAQSLANIALQSEIVQRLATRGDPRLGNELGSLRTMVQAALETTKEFIFDVRPMVLDDLGLVPTLRRLVTDRGRRSGSIHRARCGALTPTSRAACSGSSRRRPPATSCFGRRSCRCAWTGARRSSTPSSTASGSRPGRLEVALRTTSPTTYRPPCAR
jgi:two-component system sensor histidine kinase DegS